MRRLLTGSGLFALALFATATAQEPAAPYWERTVVGSDFPFPFQLTRAQPSTAPKPEDKKGEKKADPTDAAIAAALANDPDVKMAKAKMQLAEAELAKARQAVALKVLAVRSAVQDAKSAVMVAQLEADNTLRLLRAEKVPNETFHPSYRLALTKLEAAQAKLALAESELRLLTGGAASATADPSADPGQASALSAWLLAVRDRPMKYDELFLHYLAALEVRTVKGPIPDRIRAALDKPVKLGVKGDRVTFEKALEVFKKEAGLDVTVRGPTNQVGTITSEGEEMSVGAWFQLFEDHTYLAPNDLKGPNRKARFYVREYGVLLAPSGAAPPDAPSLTDFWKQKPPAKETKPEPKK